MKNYQDLIKSLKLLRISNPHGEYSRNEDFDLSRKKKLSVKTERANFEHGYSINGDTLDVPVAYRVWVSLQESEVAFCEFHFRVEFQIRDLEKVTQLLSNDDLREFFVGYQMDKFVWSYLRCYFNDVSSKMGLPCLTLPMLI